MKVREYVEEKLRIERWSPESISGRIRIDIPEEKISVEVIYQYIYHPDNQHMKLWHYLKLHRTRRLKKDGRKVRKSKLKDTVSIEMRPREVQERSNKENWETDNMEGKKIDKTTVSVTVERMSKHNPITITADNGRENALIG